MLVTADNSTHHARPPMPSGRLKAHSLVRHGSPTILNSVRTALPYQLLTVFEVEGTKSDSQSHPVLLSEPRSFGPHLDTVSATESA